MENVVPGVRDCPSQRARRAVTLGVVVLVRTFLSFSLENELEGVVSWRRSAAQTDRGSVRTSGSG
jgi:hypothetical protein